MSVKASTLVRQQSVAGGAIKPIHDARAPASRKNYGVIPRKKNGPALGGYGAATMTNALRKAVAAMPAQLSIIDLGPWQGAIQSCPLYY